MGLVILRLFRTAFRVERPVFFRIQRQEIQPATHRRIFAPESAAAFFASPYRSSNGLRYSLKRDSKSTACNGVLSSERNLFVSERKGKMKITIRTRVLKTENCSIYLDFYEKGERWNEYLNLFLVPDNVPDAKRLNNVGKGERDKIETATRH